MGIRGQLTGVTSLYHVGPGVQTQPLKLVSNCFHPLSHLMVPYSVLIGLVCDLHRGHKSQRLPYVIRTGDKIREIQLSAGDLPFMKIIFRCPIKPTTATP